MEDLTKSQLILLTLFVSFVTSIATGIVTVTLLEEAPVAVTQTVNRVVEHTIERIVPGETRTTVREVVVTNDDLVARLVAENKAAIVQVEIAGTPDVDTEKDPTDKESETGQERVTQRVTLGTAVLVDSAGILVSSKSSLASVTTGMEVRFANNESQEVELLDVAHPSLAVMRLKGSKEEKSAYVNLADRTAQLGEPLVGLGYHEGNLAVEVGRVVAVSPARNASSTSLVAPSDKTTPTTVAKSDIGAQWPVLSSKGKLIGFNIPGEGIVSSQEVTDLVLLALQVIMTKKADEPVSDAPTSTLEASQSARASSVTPAGARRISQ